jgi:hypothetical protein
MLKFLSIALACLFIHGCGGGDSDASNSLGTSNQTSVSTLNLTSTSIAGKKFLSLSPSTPSTSLSFLDRIIDFMLPSAFADSEELEAITESSDGSTEKVFDQNLTVTGFSLPSSNNSGISYGVFSGAFSVINSNNEPINCGVIIASIDASTSTKCIHIIESGNLPLIPVATIRDGNVDGQLEDFDSVYFVTNGSEGGFKVHKFNGTDVRVVLNSIDGKITKLMHGQFGLYGFDDVTGSGKFIFGNAARGLDYTEDIIDRPLFYKGYILYPFREVDFGDRISNQSVFFDLNRVTSTTFVEDFSIRCSTPLSTQYSAAHDYGVFWISSADGKLCEAYELTGRPEKIAYRIINDSATWSQLKVSNNQLVGVAIFSGETRLIIDSIDSGLQNLAQSRSIDTTDKKAIAELDEISSLSYYSSGITIEGTLNNNPITRYFNTETGLFEIPTGNPVEIIERLGVPTFNLN